MIGVVADVARIDRDIEVALTDGTELRVDWLVASEESVFDVEPRRGDLLLYVDDVESNPWIRVARGGDSCWVFTDGSAWDAGDHWIFKSGLLLWTASGYERPYPDDDGGWSSDTSSFCLNSDGLITDGPWGPNF